jgi:hypothetical protein
MTDETRVHTTCAIDISPGVVDAGAEITLHGRVSCTPPCDLRGHTLLIKNQSGDDAGTIELTRFDGATNETGDLVLHAPLEPGECSWSAVCPAVVKDGVAYAQATAPVTFTVKPHTTNVVAWDIPSAIVAGDRFRIKVGIKCSIECDLANRAFGIHDHEGKQVARGTLAADRWPGTTALHVAEVELVAPSSEGLYAWSVRGPVPEPGLPHAEGSASFGVRVVPQPEYVVTVETVDRESRTPLSGARVVMHPYKAVTDERGVAKVRVAKGAYKLFVSQTSYLTFGLPVDVSTDMTARAELDLEPVPERN